MKVEVVPPSFRLPLGYVEILVSLYPRFTFHHPPPLSVSAYGSTQGPFSQVREPYVKSTLLRLFDIVSATDLSDAI